MAMKSNVLRLSLLGLFGGLLMHNSALARSVTDEPERWQVYGELFAWGASVEGTAATGEEIDVPLHDVLDSLEFGFMGTLAMQKKRWSLFADFIYVDAGSSAELPLPLPGMPAAKVDVDLTQFTSTFGAGYRVFRGERSVLSLIAGGRYLSLDTDVRLTLDPILDESGSRDGSDWDFIVGARGAFDLSDNWYINYYADVGTGDSDFTWQALAAVNYRLSKVDLTLGYNYLDWEFDNDAVLRDFAMSGPYLGLKFRI